MATMNLSLPAPMKEWVERQVESGRYCNAGEYVRELIRRDQQRQESIAVLQSTIKAGAESGEPHPLDATGFKLRARERHVGR